MKKVIAHEKVQIITLIWNISYVKMIFDCDLYIFLLLDSVLDESYFEPSAREMHFKEIDLDVSSYSDDNEDTTSSVETEKLDLIHFDSWLLVVQKLELNFFLPLMILMVEKEESPVEPIKYMQNCYQLSHPIWIKNYSNFPLFLNYNDGIRIVKGQNIINYSVLIQNLTVVVLT